MTLLDVATPQWEPDVASSHPTPPYALGPTPVLSRNCRDGAYTVLLLQYDTVRVTVPLRVCSRPTGFGAPNENGQPTAGRRPGDGLRDHERS